MVGIFACIAGTVGINDNNTKWVRIFAWFVIIRTFFRVLIFWWDFNELRDCEKFALSSVTQGQYNVAMEVVVLKNSCGDHRVFYPIISALDVGLSLYGVSNALFWAWAQEHGPMYAISLDESKALRIYTGYSSVGHPDAPPTVQDVGAEYQSGSYGYNPGDGYNPGYNPGAMPQSGYYGAPGRAQLPY
jgi:hypothetical protein